MKLTDVKESCTEKEIQNQPALWGKIYDQLLAEKSQLVLFLNEATSHRGLNVILTGAGSSAFIGLSVVGSFKQNFKWNTSAVATTDIVTHPTSYFCSEVRETIARFCISLPYRNGIGPEMGHSK